MELPLAVTSSNTGALVAAPEPSNSGVTGMVHAYRRRLPLFLTVLAACIALALLFTWLQTPRYTATASVMIAPTRADIGSGSAANAPPDVQSDANVDSQVEVLRSGALAEAVVDKLNLTHDPAFAASLKPPGRFGRHRPAPAPSRAVAVAAVEKGLAVRRVAQTLILEVAYASPDRVLARRIADAFADAYVAQSVEVKLTDSRAANALLGAQLGNLRAQVEAAETAVAAYKARYNLLSVQGSTMAEQEIAALDQQVAANRASAAEAAARLQTARQQMARGSHGDDVGEALGSPVIQELRKQRAAASQRLADLQVRFGPRFPDVISAKDQIADIDTQINAEIKRVVSNLEAQNQVAARRVGSLEGSLGEARGTLGSGNTAVVKLNELQRTAEAARTLYEGVLNRVKETQTLAATARADARITSYAATPDRPSSPKPAINLLLGTLLGVGLGIGAVVLRQELDTGLSTLDDVEGRLRLPYFGALPTLGSSVRGSRSRSAHDVMTQNAGSSFAEAFRGLAAALAYNSGRRSPFVVALTSALPKEGKTVASVCLARMMAMMRMKVVLVDCDLRRPSVADTLRLSPRAGLLEVLDGQVTLDEALIVDPDSDMCVLPLKDVFSTESPFASAAMDRLLSELRSRFDVVVLDTSPVLPVVESRVLCQKADAVVLLVRWRKTPEKAAMMAAHLLQSMGVRIEGVALTRVDLKVQGRSGYGDPTFYQSKFRSYYTS